MKRLSIYCMLLVMLVSIPFSAFAENQMSCNPDLADNVTIASKFSAWKWFDTEEHRAKLSVLLYLDFITKYEDFDIDVTHSYVGRTDDKLAVGYWSNSSDSVIIIYEPADYNKRNDSGKATGKWLPELTEGHQMRELFDMTFKQFYSVSIEAQLDAFSWVDYELGKVSMKDDYENALTTLKEKLLVASSNVEPTNINLDELGIWTLVPYKDEFKQPTGEEYISTSEFLTGTFSNSAATDEYLAALFLADEDGMSIMLAEYGKNLVRGYSSRKIEYTVKLRDTYGNVKTLYATLHPNESQLRFSDDSIKDIIEALKQNGTISFYVERDDRKVENYLFSIEDTSFFGNAWRKLTGEEL